MLGARFPDDPSVLGKRLVVGLVADLLEQPGRAFDIREEEGDSARREISAQGPSIADVANSRTLLAVRPGDGFELPTTRGVRPTREARL